MQDEERFDSNIAPSETRSNLRIISILACVLALDTADKGAMGAMTQQLQQVFHVGKTEIGLLLMASTLISGLATIPFGWLADRVNRIRILTFSILSWAFVMAIMATSISYFYLFVTRVALGATTAAALPTVASLIGDFFPSNKRGKIYSYVLSGEFIGHGFGFLVAGQLAELSWRYGFLSMTVPALLLAWIVHALPDPLREKRDWMRADRKSIKLGSRKIAVSNGCEKMNATVENAAYEEARKKGIAPRKRLISEEDPQQKSIWWALFYVIRIPTNLVLIIASALSFYLFSGARAFGVEFLEGRFSLSHFSSIWLVVLLGGGSLIGIFAGGRLSDRLLAGGNLSGRVSLVPIAYFLTGVLFIPGLLLSTLYLAVLPLIFASACLGGASPSLDAARLDIMHPHLWGRAEAARMMFRRIAEAIAPLLFGYCADQVFGGGTTGLQKTTLVMLIPLFLGALISLIALRTYPRDVVTAGVYTQLTRGKVCDHQ